MAKGWNIHGATALPEIRDIIREEIVMDELIAEKLLPSVKVITPVGKVKVISAGQSKKVVDAARSHDGSYKRVRWSMGKDFFETSVYGVECDWDNMEALANSTEEVDEQTEAGMVATGILLNSREARVSEAFFNTTTFTGSDYSSDEAGNKWDLEGTDILARLEIGQAKLYKRYGLWLHHLTLALHPTLISKMVDNIAVEAGVDGNRTTSLKLLPHDKKAAVIADRYGLKEVISLSAPYNDQGWLSGSDTSVEEANFTDIYDKTKAMLYLPSNPKVGFRGPGIGWQPVFEKMTKDYEIEQYAEPGVDGQVIRAKEWRGTKVRKGFGFLYRNVQ
jgi:hypothetical protein